MTPEEQARIRADFRVKFGILRRAYPRFNIPDFGEGTPLDEIHAQYERYVRHIHVDSNVDQYKVYLIVLWLIIEFLCTRVLGLDIQGYTVSQMSTMNRYDRLLIELGEKDTGPTASNWPVEARIIILSLFNAVLFLIIKVVGSYLGPTIASLVQPYITGLLSGNSTQNLINDLNRAQAGLAAGGGSGGEGGPGGLDLTSIVGAVTSMFGNMGSGNSAPAAAAGTTTDAAPARPRASRRPRYTE